MSYIPNFKEIAQSRLLSQYRDDKFVQAYAKALGSVAQTLEDELYDAIISSRLDTAVGVWLDQWGDVVGEARGTLDDQEFRQIILSKIRSNRSNGLPKDVDKTITAAFDPVDYQLDHEVSPAASRVTIFLSGSPSAELIRRASNIVESAFPAGVTVEIVESNLDTPLTFDKAAPLSLDSGLLGRQVF